MEHTRKRTNVTGRKRRNKRVSFNLDEPHGSEASEGDMRRSLRRNWKFIGLGVVVVVLILRNVIRPTTKFPKEVQYWHDSGYLFKFRQFDIHFQDIPRNKKPVSLTPVLLVLHGFPTSSYDWKDLIPKFHKKFGRVIIPDLLGFGFSDKPIDHVYSLKEQATMIEELLNYLKIRDVHILAHDYGDTVAQELIARADDPKYHLLFNIKSVCLTNGGIIPSQIQLLLIQKLLLLPITRSLAPYLTNQFLFNSRFSVIFGPNTQPTSKQLLEFYTIISHKGGHYAVPAIMKYLPERYANEERWVGALKETLIPLHLIYGPLDPIGTPDGFLKKYKEFVPNSSITVLDGIGHYPQLEDKTRFAKAYFSFLDRVAKEYYVL